jgi:purine-cytosine permease-like protein
MTRIERRSIDVVPAGERHGTPRSQFTLWFGANMQVTAIVATLGYRYIHVLGRIATVVGIIGFTYLMIRLVTNYDLSSLIGQKPFDSVTFLLAISLGAGWQADVRAVSRRLLAVPAAGHS